VLIVAGGGGGGGNFPTPAPTLKIYDSASNPSTIALPVRGE
jgi:hypothetical protein